MIIHLTHIDDDARGALVNQKNSLKPAVDWLKKEQERLDDSLRRVAPEGFQHIQGASQMLSEVIAYLKDPEETFMAQRVKAATDKVSSLNTNTR